MEDQCLFCTNGIVEAFCGTDIVDWECPNCGGTGIVSNSIHALQEDVFNTDINKAGGLT